MKQFYTLLIVLCFATPLATSAQVSLNAINTAYEQDFNTVAATGTTNEITTLPQGWLFAESGTNANTTYAAGTGSSNTGNTYSFGLDATDRAFGGLLSGSLTPTIGAGFTNATGSTITSLQITYRGEQWRLGATGRNDRLDFQYSTNATSLTSGTWTDVDNLDFSSPVTTGTAGLLNGNAAGNNSTITFVIEGLFIENGSSFFIRWNDFNASSADDGLAVDDFSIVPVGVPPTEPSITFTPAALAFGDVNAGTEQVLKYDVKGENLGGPINISVSHPFYLIGTDSVTFSSAIVLPDSGGVVFVKFSPTVNGAANTTIAHASGGFSKDLPITGSGFEQSANIIPIATARTKPVGTKVTVAGRITVANELGNPAYVQDETGGLPVFDFNLASTVTLGDSVWVTGPIGIFNEQKQISGAGIFHTRIDTTPRIPAPKPITIGELAANEGLLVSVQNVELLNKSFVFYPQSTERITDGVLQADLRIDGDTDIPGFTKPQASVNIIGVVGRFRANAQLLPRFRQDIPGATEPTTPFDSIPKRETLDVANWNLEFFGARSEDYNNEEFGPADEQLQLQNVKRVFDSLDADIIAVQEVSDESLFADLVSQLEGYSFICSPRYSRSFQGPSNEFPPQKVCLIYDTTTIDVLTARALFEARYDSARTTDPSLLPGIPGGNPSSFYSSGRLPYLVTVNATLNGVTERISLINVHAKSGATADDRNRRAYDATVLNDSLNANFANEQIIFLGDLNDDLDQSIVSGLPTPYAMFVNDTAGYSAPTKALSDAGARSTLSYGDVIDHQLISNELNSEYLNGSAQIITPFRYVSNYAATTSDHLPVVVRYAFQKPVVQFTSSSTALTEDTVQYTLFVTLDKTLSASKQIQISLGGEAAYGEDFIVEPPAIEGVITLNLQAGDSTASLRITTINDIADELTEAATFTLNPQPGFAIGEPSVFTLSIEDNDIPTISFVERSARAEEGSGPYVVRLKLSTPPATEQTVTIWARGVYHAKYGDDYLLSPAPVQNKIKLVLPAGSDSAQFGITPLTDRMREKHGEQVVFYLAETTIGLLSEAPRLSFFTIIDKRRHPHFTVFPNPTHDLFTLLANEWDSDETINAQIRNNQGEMTFNETGTLAQINEKITQKFKSSRKGIYLLTVAVGDETYLIRILKN